MLKSLIPLLSFLALAAGPAQAREWNDASGHYHLEADLVAYDDHDIVLQKTDKTLVSVDVEKLSQADQEYLKSEEAAAALGKWSEQQQTWTMKNGLKVIGKVVDYVKREITVRRFRNKIYVNDDLFENLPDVYKTIVPRIVGNFAEQDISDEAGLREWLIRRKGEPATFTCEGVLLELKNGDLYAVPFFLFSNEDLEVLKPGWDRWMAAESDQERRQEEAMHLETQARLYQENQDSVRNLMKLQVDLQAYNAGLFNMWEVALYPNPGTHGTPKMVVVPGRNSRQAEIAALEKNPGYRVGPVAKVTRQF